MSDIDIPALKPLAATTGPLIRPRDHHRSVQHPDLRFLTSVADPDPSDPYVFGPPGSGSISQRYGSGSFNHLSKISKKNLDSCCFVTSFLAFYL